MQIVIVGAGYVGLVSGASFADFGHSVICVDKDAKKINTLERGEIPIYEPGLHDLVRTNVNKGTLSFTTNFAKQHVPLMRFSLPLARPRGGVTGTPICLTFMT